MAKKNIATFLGPQLGLSVVGDHCYAYSGVIATAGSQSAATDTSLSFTSGKFYSKVRLTWSNDLGSVSANEFYLVKMNGVIVYQAENEHNLDTVTNPLLIHLIIPPLTNFETLVGSSGDPMNTTTIITGRVYA
jgi:hypothetical protein